MPFYSDFQTEPKRSFRYLFYLSGEENVVQPYTVQTVKKPNFTVEGPVEAKYIQHTFKYPGRVRWEDVSVTIIDPGGANEDAGLILNNMLARAGYSVPRGGPAQAPTVNESISKAKARQALGLPRLAQIDDLGRQIDEWTLHNAYLANVDFGQLSYNEDSLVTYTLTITYDFATYRGANIQALTYNGAGMTPQGPGLV